MPSQDNSSKPSKEIPEETERALLTLVGINDTAGRSRAAALLSLPVSVLLVIVSAAVLIAFRINMPSKVDADDEYATVSAGLFIGSVYAGIQGGKKLFRVARPLRKTPITCVAASLLLMFLVPTSVDCSYIAMWTVFKSPAGIAGALHATANWISSISGPLTSIARHPLLATCVLVSALLLFYGPLRRDTKEKIDLVTDALGG